MAGESKGFGKSVRKKLRQLTTEAYNRELGQHLAELAVHFKKWETREITSSELSDLIHQFHQGPAREIFGVYDHFDPEFLVARGLAYGHLSWDEVPEKARTFLESRVQNLRELYDIDQEEDDTPKSEDSSK